MTFEIESSTPKSSGQPAEPKLSARRVAGAQTMTYRRSRWRETAIGLNLLILLFAVIWITGWFVRGSLPNPSVIVNALRSAPLQRETALKPFDFEYAKSSYVIEPLAEYDISGLIVTHNDPGGWGDIYHDDSSVDFRDLCLIWGSNLNSVIFENFEFWSEPWTCNARTYSDAAVQAFDLSALGNNHLLSADQEVQQTINSARIGDQIHLKGLLIDYYPPGMKEYGRRSSLTRDDTGNGACEVMYVQSAEILKRAPELGYAMFTWGKRMFFGSLLMRVIVVLLVPFGLVAKPRW